MIIFYAKLVTNDPLLIYLKAYRNIKQVFEYQYFTYLLAE